MRGEPLEIVVDDGPVESADADVRAIPIVQPPGGDGPLGERLARLASEGELKGTVGEVVLLHEDGRFALAGLGKKPNAETLRTAAAGVAARAAGIGEGAVAWPIGTLGLDPAEEARAIVEGTALGAYDPGAWKTNDDRRAPVGRLVLCGPVAAGQTLVARRAAVVAAWTNRCRELVNAPANELTPERLAERAAEAADEVPHLRLSTLDRAAIESAGMGAFAAVARGSHHEPRLIVLDYEPPGASADLTLGLVGKAITFDSGGISLKPAARMEEMKGDMAGGAAVVCGLAAVAALELPVRAVAVVAACENMPSGHAVRPGDIVTALSGKTIEVTNTDAEGRLVLADALADVRRRGATHVLDLATLTGGIVVALGDFYAGLMGNDDDWVAEVQAAADTSGDHAWRLPVHETYRRYLESTFADFRNSSGQRYAQPVYAATFLQEFAGDGPWAHLDIAGTAHLERGRGDVYAQKGATGYGVRLIAALAERLASSSEGR
jgi:leucyl aminopeptidase